MRASVYVCPNVKCEMWILIKFHVECVECIYIEWYGSLFLGTFVVLFQQQKINKNRDPNFGWFHFVEIIITRSMFLYLAYFLFDFVFVSDFIYIWMNYFVYWKDHFLINIWRSTHCHTWSSTYNQFDISPNIEKKISLSFFFSDIKYRPQRT